MNWYKKFIGLFSGDTLNSEKGKRLRDLGIEQSLATAESTHDSWADKAYNYLLDYMLDNKEFMTEDVRIASMSSIPIPTNTRAWGGIVVRARRNNLIQRKGYSAVKNPKAHRTPATLWEVI